MAKIIEFCTGSHLIPIVKQPVSEERGKVIPFISQREVGDETACVTFEQLVLEPSGWREWGGILYHEALEYAQPPIPDGRPLVKIFELHGARPRPTVVHSNH